MARARPHEAIRTPATSIRGGSSPAVGHPEIGSAARNRARALLRDRPLLAALIATLAVALPALAFLRPQYDTNDDTSMNLIAAGRAFVDHPDEHLVYTNVLIGFVLKWLYEAAPRTPWYGIYQLATLTAAAVATAYVLLRVSPTLRQAGLVALFLLVAFLPSLALVQFTKTAFLVTLAGLLLLLAPATSVPHRKRLAASFGVAFFVLGSLIRFEGMLMACLISLPAVLASGIRLGRSARQAAVPLAIAVLIAVALNFLNNAYYARDPEWKDFYSYNALRAQFTDYRKYQTGAAGPTFEAVGWQPVDLRMLEEWFFADPARYSLDTLRRIVAEAPRDPPAPFYRVAYSLVAQCGQNDLLLRLALASIAAAALTTGRRWLFLPPVLFGVAFGIGVALSKWYWITPRVAFSLLSGVLAVTGLRPERDISATGTIGALVRKAVVGAAAVAAVGLSAWSLIGLARIDTRCRQQNALKASLVDRLEPRPDQLFLCWSDRFPFEYLVTPLADLDGLRDFRCIGLSWLLPTPFTARRMEEFHVRDIYPAIWERPDVFLVASRRLIEMLGFYAMQHYDVRLKWRVVFDRDTLQVFQATRPDARE